MLYNRIDTGLWFTENCGEKRGFLCRKEQGSGGTKTPPTTVQIPGQCPHAYFAAGGELQNRLQTTPSDTLPVVKKPEIHRTK